MAKFMIRNEVGRVVKEGATVVTVTTAGAVAKGDVKASYVCLDTLTSAGECRAAVSGCVSVKNDGAVAVGDRLYISQASGKTTWVTKTAPSTSPVACGIALTAAAGDGIIAMQIDF